MVSPKRVPVWKAAPKRSFTPVWKTLAFVVATGLFIFGTRTIPHMPKVVAVAQPIFNLLPGLTGYFFAMAGLALMLMPEELRGLERFRKSRLIIAAVLVILGLGAVVSDSVQRSAQTEKAEAYRSELMGQISKLTDQQGSLIAQVETMTRETLPKLLGGVESIPSQLAQDAKPLPDLSLELVHPTEVDVRIRNDPNGGVADRPKYQLVLSNLDNLDANILQIPVRMGDFIRPGSAWGPNRLMGLPAVQNVVKPGDRVFGYGMVQCPDCARTRSYWIYIEQGIGGWYCEMPTPLYPSNAQFFVDMKNNLNAYLDALAPATCRVQIGN